MRVLVSVLGHSPVRHPLLSHWNEHRLPLMNLHTRRANKPATQELTRRHHMGVAKMKGGPRNKAIIFRIGLVARVLSVVALACSFTRERAPGASAAAPQSVQQL